jgi:hypothetical protein
MGFRDKARAGLGMIVNIIDNLKPLKVLPCRQFFIRKKPSQTLPSAKPCKKRPLRFL